MLSNQPALAVDTLADWFAPARVQQKKTTSDTLADWFGPARAQEETTTSDTLADWFTPARAQQETTTSDTLADWFAPARAQQETITNDTLTEWFAPERARQNVTAAAQTSDMLATTTPTTTAVERTHGTHASCLNQARAQPTTITTPAEHTSDSLAAQPPKDNNPRNGQPLPEDAPEGNIAHQGAGTTGSTKTHWLASVSAAKRSKRRRPQRARSTRQRRSRARAV